MSNIFQLSEEYLQLMSEIEENEGVITDELAERLLINEKNFADKMDAYSNIITLKNADINVIEDEIKRLTALKTSKENSINRLKSIMIDAIKLYGNEGKTGNKTFKTVLHSFWTVNTKPLSIDDDAVIPETYKKFIVNGTLDTDGMKKLDNLIQTADLANKITFEGVNNIQKLKEDVKYGVVTIEGVKIDEDACYLRIK